MSELQHKWADVEIGGEGKTVRVVSEKEYGVIVGRGGVTWTVNEDRLFNIRDEK